MNNPTLRQNPVAQNAIQLYQSGDIKGLQELANNVCKETNTTADAVKQQLMNRFNIH